MTTIQNNQKKISMPGEPQVRNISPNVAGKKEFFEQNAFNQASSPNEPTGAHLSAHQEGQQDRFNKARGAFENGNINAPKVGEPIKKTSQVKYATLKFENGNANALKVGEPIKKTSQVKYATLKFENGNTRTPKVGEAIDAQGFKHKVKMSGIIHTSTRRNNVGDGLNEVPKNVAKKTNSSTPIQRTDSTSSVSSIEDASLDTSAYNVNGRKKVTFADPREPVATGPEVKQQLPETQRIIDNAEKWSNLLNESKSTVPFIPKERSGSDVSSWSTSTQPKAPSNQAEIDRAMRENIEGFEKNSNVESKRSNSPTIDDMLFGEINDATPCLEPQKNEVVPSAGDELETVKFLKTLSKGEREKLGFSDKQPKNRNLVRCSITHEYNMINPTMIRSSDNNILPKQETIIERDSITHEVSTEPKMERSSNNEVSPKQESNREMCGVTRNKTKNAFNKPPLSMILETDLTGSKKGGEKDR